MLEHTPQERLFTRREAAALNVTGVVRDLTTVVHDVESAVIIRHYG
jgi:hypothetical protein